MNLQRSLTKRVVLKSNLKEKKYDVHAENDGAPITQLQEALMRLDGYIHQFEFVPKELPHAAALENESDDDENNGEWEQEEDHEVGDDDLQQQEEEDGDDQDDKAEEDDRCDADSPLGAELNVVGGVVVEKPAGVPAVRRRSSAKFKHLGDLDPNATFQSLFARQTFASHWNRMRKQHVAICGLGGIGAQVAECLVRSGIGKLLLIDNGRVKMASMGRMFFRPDETGLSKLQAVRLRLQGINSKATIESCATDVTNEIDLGILKKKLKAGSVAHGQRGGGVIGSHTVGLYEALMLKRPYDLVVCCLDNDDARLRINQVCLELSIPLLDVCMEPGNLRFSVRSVLPGHSCCLDCIRVSEYCAEQDISKSIATFFPATLPHVESLAAGFVSQSVAKFLLEFGQFVPFYDVDLLKMTTQAFTFRPNPDCQQPLCRERQQDVAFSFPRHHQQQQQQQQQQHLHHHQQQG